MSERRLSEIARHLVRPSGIVGSDFNLVNRAAVKAGIRYDLWQQGFLYLLLAKREDGRYACGSGGAVLSSCRQIGKTFMIGTAMFILCAGRKGTLVIWTAHHTRTSDETFNDLCELARTPVLVRYVDHIRRANGQQEIRFSNGSRIMFGARENGFGRGLHSADIEVFDEAQILTVKALDNLIPIVNTSPNPLVVLMGNPPKPGDQSEAFAEKRANALAGADGMLYVELSADTDADPDDRDQWAKANPSYPRRAGDEAILRMRNLLAGTASGARRWASGTRPRACMSSTRTCGPARPSKSRIRPDCSRSAWTCPPTAARWPSDTRSGSRTGARWWAWRSTGAPARRAWPGRWNGWPNAGPRPRPWSSTRSRRP